MENLLLEHEKKFVEMQKTIDQYQENGVVVVDQDKKSKENSPVEKILKENPKSIDSLKFKYLVMDIITRIENLDHKEKNFVEQIHQILNHFHDENEELHKMFDEIQRRLNIFGVKKYDEILDCLNIYKKYVDIPLYKLIEIEKL